MTKTKLWRVLGATSPLFEVVTQFNGTMNDHKITEISTTRGNGSPFGLSTGSAQLKFRGVAPGIPTQADTWLRVKFTDHGAARIVALTGGGDPAALRNRLTGRRVSETFDDTGDPNSDRATTTYTAHDYGAAVVMLDRGSYALSTDTDLAAIHARAMTRVGYETPFEALNTGTPWPRPWVPETEVAITTADVFARYGSDHGILTRITRNGTPQSLTQSYRDARGEALRTAVAGPGIAQALQRRQALSPIQWARNAVVPIRLKATWRDSTGTVWITERSMGTAGLLDKTEEIDLTAVVSTFTAVDTVLLARIQQAAQLEYTPTGVTIDLLHLLSTGRDDDKYLARQLLLLEAGDPVALAADWPWQVSGIFTADQIDERITGDGYHITLTLNPRHYLLGVSSYDVAGRTWQQAYRGGWGIPPVDHTWANAPNVT